MAKLTPVDFDPFSQSDFSDVSTTVASSEAPAAPTKRVKTTPVDYDPFASAPKPDEGYGQGIVNALRGMTADAPLVSRVEGLRRAITPDILLGAQGRGLDVLASVTRGVANVAEPIGDALETAIPLTDLTPEQVRNEKQLQTLYSLSDVLRDGADSLEYQGGATWEDVKASPLSMATPQFVAEQGMLSLPDMAGSVAALPAYILGRTEEIGERRVTNDGRQGEPELGDMLAAAPGAVIESLLERFATKRLPIAAGGGNAAARVGKEAVVQAGTEAVEEGAANLGESVGTERGVNVQELVDAMGAGALTGGGIGAGVRAATEAMGRPGEARKVAEAVVDGELDPEMLRQGAEALAAAAPPAETAQEAPQRAAEPEATQVTPEPSAEAADKPRVKLADYEAWRDNQRAEEDRRNPEAKTTREVFDSIERSQPAQPDRMGELQAKRASGEALNAEEATELLDLRDADAKVARLAGSGMKLPGVGTMASERAVTEPVRKGFIDIDNFKQVNDEIGHSAGDQVIGQVAELLATEFPGTAFHKGGDEFVVHGATDAEVAEKLERVRSTLQSSDFELTGADGKAITISGVGSSFGTGGTIDEADAKLRGDKLARKDAGLRFDRAEGDRRSQEVEGAGQNSTEAAAGRADKGQVSERPGENDDREASKREPVGSDEASPTGKRTTSLKNEVTDKERADDGRDAILRDTVVENRQAVRGALDALDADKKLGEKTANRLMGSGQAGTLEDSAVLLADRMRLMKERAALEKTAADPEATPQDQAQAILELDAIEQKITTNDLAAVSVGTEAARILQLRTRLINEDFSVANLERRERIQKGRALTADERATLRAESEAVLGKQRAVLASDQKVDDHLTNEAISATYKNMIREMADQLGVGGPRRKRGKTLEAMKAAADESRKWLREADGVSSNKQAGAVMDPRAFFHLARIGAYHIANGASTLADFVARMKADIGAVLFGKAEPAIEDVYEAAKVQHAATAGGDPVAKAMESVEDGNLTHANVYNVAKAHITAGVKGEGPVMAATLETLKAKFPELTERDVRRLFSDYGRARFPSKDADAREARRLKTLVRLQESIDRLREGLPALRTGLQRDKQDAEIRQRQRDLNDLLKASEAQNGLDPGRLASYQQARANNLRNQIEDLNREISTGEKKAPRPASPADNSEVAALRATRDRLRAELKAIADKANPPKSASQKREEARVESLGESIKRLKDLLAGKLEYNRPQVKVHNDAIAALEKTRDELAEQLAAMRADAKPKRSEEEKAIASMEAGLRSRLKAIENELLFGKKVAKEKPAPSDTAKMLQAAIEAYEDIRAAIDLRANPPLTEDQKYQKRRGTQLQKMLDATLERIRNGDYSKNPRPEPRELTAENQRLHYELQEAKAKIARRQLAEAEAAKPTLKRIFGFAGESINAARTVQLSFDNSFLLNQGGLYFLRYPERLPAVLKRSMTAFFSPEKASALERNLKNDPDYALMVRAGLPLVGEASPNVANQDEAYNTRWLEKFLDSETADAGAVSKGLMKTRNLLTLPLRASQRAYNVAANDVRAGWFKSLHNSDARAGTMTREQLKELANVVAVFTGRSSIKDIQQAAGLMSKMFLAWHWTASRFQTVLGVPYWQASPAAKKVIGRTYARILMNFSAMQGLLLMGAAIYNAQHDDDDDERPVTDFDPRSSNFMKYRYGDTWVGLSAGLGPTITFLSRLATGETKSGPSTKGALPSTKLKDLVDLPGFDAPLWLTESAVGQTRVGGGKISPLLPAGTITDWTNGDDPNKKPSAYHAGGRFLIDFYHNRASPIAGYFFSAKVKGVNPAGQQFDPAADALKMVTPINFNDVGDILKENGPVAGPAMLAWRFLGGNTDYRDPKAKFGEREPLPWETTDKERP